MVEPGCQVETGYVYQGGKTVPGERWDQMSHAGQLLLGGFRPGCQFSRER